jgi:hypothetical protein
MRLALVVGALLFNLVVAGAYETGLFDLAGAPAGEAGTVQAFEDVPPPPPSWP